MWYCTTRVVRWWQYTNNHQNNGGDIQPSREKQTCDHTLQVDNATTSASNNVDNKETEVVDGVEGDAFSATEQSRFHPPDQPKLKRRKRDKALSKDSREKRSKPAEEATRVEF